MLRQRILLVLVFLTLTTVSGIKINEVEANPQGSDSGEEWVELYTEETVSIDGWKIMRSDNKTQNLSGNITSGYYTINISTQWITNTQENIYLINNNGEIIDSLVSINDSANDNKSWQYCPEGWIFISETKTRENNCQIAENNTANNTPQNAVNVTNITQNNNTNQSENQTSLIIIKTDFSQSFRNGEEAELLVEMINLENYYYDIKILLTDDEESTLSEINIGEGWQNSFYYIKDFIKGPGNLSKTVRIRIKEEYSDLEGEYKIDLRLRKRDSSSYKQITGKIMVLPKNNEEVHEEKSEFVTTSQSLTSKSEASNKMIYLNYDDSQSIKSDIIYQSKNQKARNYLPYALTLLCVLIITFLLIKKNHDNKSINNF
ncbi:MAG: hypothetical protein AABW73_02865 [Nanoarchaeota archaeon]